MSATCPAGHSSTSDDYCDVCGSPIGAPPAPASTETPTEAAPTGPQDCPNCAAQAPAAALFCESCGYDFTTGALPEPPTPLDLSLVLPSLGPPVDLDLSPAAPSEGPAEPDLDTATASVEAPSPEPEPEPPGPMWVAEMWVDADWYHQLPVQPDDPLPSAGLPKVVAITTKTALIGRPSRSKNILPELDCTPDSSVSRRHAQLTTDGQRWWVEDLDSANGTFVAAASDPLPTEPIASGQRREIGGGDRVWVGGWTRLVLREALPGE